MVAASIIYATTTGDPILDYLIQAGAIGVLAFVVWCFMTGRIVRGSEVEQCRSERDRALDLVYEQAALTRRAVETAEKKAE